MKKLLSLVLVLTLAFSLAGCEKNSLINVVSREDGSGTRSAFVEITKILENGEDMTSTSAEITNSTAVMISTIEGNKNAIGYISLSSLGGNVTGVKVEGVAPTTETVKNGTYKISRPFNIVTKGETEELSKDFISFILSEEGQKIVESNGCISSGNTGKFKSNFPSGTLKVGGSTSVYPVMEKLSEAYGKINQNPSIEIQGTGSSAGISGVLDGSFDIGMASRELKSGETQKGAIPTVIGLDGIAVIVNNENTISNLTLDEIKKIFTAQLTDWNELS